MRNNTAPEQSILTPDKAELFESLYSRRDEQGHTEIVLHDPLVTEGSADKRMHSAEIPACVGGVEHLQHGLDYLQNNHPEITLFASRHANDVIHEEDEMAPLLDGHDAFFLEGYGTLEERRAIHMRAAMGELTDEDWQNYRTEPTPYTDRQLRLLMGRGKPILMPELPRDGTPEESALLAYSLLMNEFFPYAFGDDPEMTINLLIALAGSNVIREWYMLASMGNQMEQYEQATGYRIQKPLLWMGGGHEHSLVAKAGVLGLEFRTVRSRYDQEHNIADESLTRAVASFAINGVFRMQKH